MNIVRRLSNDLRERAIDIDIRGFVLYHPKVFYTFEKDSGCSGFVLYLAKTALRCWNDYWWLMLYAVMSLM